MKTSIYIYFTQSHHACDVLRQLSNFCSELELIQVLDFDKKSFIGLFFDHDKLSYYDYRFGSLSLDFDALLRDFRRQNLGKKELISRAVGQNKVVIDSTFGTGKDSLTLMYLGFQVNAFEANPVAYILGKWNLEKSKIQEDRINLKFGNGLSHYKNLSLVQKTSFYFDPMFRPEKRKALPKKGMQVFEELIANEPKFESAIISEVLAHDLIDRFVIKRPIKGPLLKEKPHHEIIGKTIRFDIYM
ncbi:MAG: class I SAM-dependent methyltransferase [Oligoflexia bacterium]|nr:class I SAM-dependent methyltransferase [Oligoflexia bacterium]